MTLLEKQKTILVTGGAGFIGSSMIRKLVNQSNNLIINIDSLTYSGNLSSLKEIQDMENYKFLNLNIGNTNQIKKVFLKYEPDIIINFAAESHVDKSIDSPNIFFETNVMKTLNLALVAKDYWIDADKDFLFHHVSTDEVYGDIPKNNPPSNETIAYKPSSPYAASKASSDHMLRALHRTYGLPITISNCSNNYGPYQFPEKLIPHVIINILMGKQLPVYGDGSQIRDWLHTNDHIAGILNIIEFGQIGDTYNIGGNNELSNLHVIEMICDFMDKNFKSKLNNFNSSRELISFVTDRPGHDKRYAIDTSKMLKTFNWKPKIEFKNGLEETVNWYVENEWWWSEILDSKYQMNRQGNK